MYDWEADQEDFLILADEPLLIVEGQERPLRQWDFVHCPPRTGHIIVGAGEDQRVGLAVGAREHQTGEWVPIPSTSWPSAMVSASSRRPATPTSRTPGWRLAANCLPRGVASGKLVSVAPP